MKRLLLPLAAALAVVVAGCPPDTPENGCAQNTDCGEGELCSAGQCVTLTNDEGEGEDVGEGEGDVGGEGEGDVAGEGEGEGEGEGDPPPPVVKLSVDVVVGAPSVRTAGTLRLTGGTLVNTPPVLRGARFTLRAASIGEAP